MAHRDKATKKGVSRGGFIGTVAASTANVAAAAAATATIATTITTSGGHVVTVSDFISQFGTFLSSLFSLALYLRGPNAGVDADKGLFYVIL